jgi:hypothetical protein
MGIALLEESAWSQVVSPLVYILSGLMVRCRARRPTPFHRTRFQPAWLEFSKEVVSMRIPKHLAVIVSSLAFAGATAFVTAAAAPATAAILTGGHGGHEREGGGANFGEDFILEEGDFFLNEEDDPHPRG